MADEVWDPLAVLRDKKYGIFDKAQPGWVARYPEEWTLDVRRAIRFTLMDATNEIRSRPHTAFIEMVGYAP